MHDQVNSFVSFPVKFVGSGSLCEFFFKFVGPPLAPVIVLTLQYSPLFLFYISLGPAYFLFSLAWNISEREAKY